MKTLGKVPQQIRSNCKEQKTLVWVNCLFRIFLIFPDVGNCQTIEVPPDASIALAGNATKTNSTLLSNAEQSTLNLVSDVRIHPTDTRTQSEMSIAVNPLNHKVLLASANATSYPPPLTIFGTGYYISTDGGMTWTGNDQPPSGNNRGDPATAIDRLGYFYIGSIAPNLGQGIISWCGTGGIAEVVPCLPACTSP